MRERIHSKSGMELLGHRGASDDVALLDDQDG